MCLYVCVCLSVKRASWLYGTRMHRERDSDIDRQRQSKVDSANGTETQAIVIKRITFQEVTAKVF